jgi:hypothetical protein
MRFSNGGSKIAWLLEQKITPPIPPFLHPFLPQSAWQTRTRVSLQVSDLDGTKMRAVGYFDGDTYSLDDLRWLPGDHSLSFMYNGNLW